MWQIFYSSKDLLMHISSRSWEKRVRVLFVANNLQHHVASFVHNRIHTGEKLYKSLVWDVWKSA